MSHLNELNGLIHDPLPDSLVDTLVCRGQGNHRDRVVRDGDAISRGFI